MLINYYVYAELSVRIPKPVTEGTIQKLSCQNDCSLKGNLFTWRKNGKDIPVKHLHSSEFILQDVSTDDKGNYSCALKGQESYPSKPVELNVLCKYQTCKDQR